MTMATTCLMLFALTLSASLISGAHPQSETQALIALKKSLSDPLNVTGTWDASHPKPCSWKHVTCNGDKKVIGLSLIKSRLSGHLVPELGSLSYLQKIIMDHNELSGPIPYSLGDLRDLTTLILSYNVLEGDIPPTLGKLRRLSALGLDNNHLVGRIPAETATLPSLRMAAFYANIDSCWMFKPTQPKFRADYHVPLIMPADVIARRMHSYL